MQKIRTRRLLTGSPAALAVVWLTACGPALRTGPNAVGVHIAGAGQTQDPPAIDSATGVSVGSTSGVRFSYGRRIRGARRVWLGPEATVGFTRESPVSAPRGDYPRGVSRTYVTGLMRLNVFPPEHWGPDVEFLHRIAFDFGGGLAFARFAESRTLIDGSRRSSPISDNAVGPAFGFGLDYQLSRHAVFRIDGSFMLLEPHLSFPWPKGVEQQFVGGGGLVVVF